MTKSRLSVYLDTDLMNALAAHADRRDHSRSLVAEAAIASFLSPDDSDRREAALAKRLDAIDRRMARIERDVGINTEMFALFVRSWLQYTPTMSDSERSAMRKQGGQRYDAFLEALGRRLANGPKLRHEILEDIAGLEG